MTTPNHQPRSSFLELLEPRIAPAALAGVDYKAITFGEQYLTAGQGLSTSQGGTGSLVLAVEKGEAVVFTTDLNGNNRFDPNEITGVAAGDGLRLTSFVDINGDIVTNLAPNSRGQLSDSDGDAANGRDGKLLLNSRIENITLRSVTQADLPADQTVSSRLALSSYSVHGFIYAGGGLGTATSPGLVIDTSGLADQLAKFSGGDVDRQTEDVVPNIGGIATGTSASGALFSFGFKTTGADAGQQPVGYGGRLESFRPLIGQAGGDVIGVSASGLAGAADEAAVPEPKPFTIGFITTGDGGIGARGGDILNVTLMGDIGGLRIVAGRGGDGVNGGAGGNITNLSDLGSYNSVVEIRAGDGGEGYLGKAGPAGGVTFGATMATNGQMAIGLGNGGIGLTQGGAGTGILSGTLTPSNGGGGFAVPVDVLSSWRPDDAISSIPADVNNDGFADMLVLSSNPNELRLVFGGPLGITGEPSLYFDAPFYAVNDPEAEGGGRSSGVVLADFNNDGLLDIATASSRENASDGLRVFVNDGTWYDKALLGLESGNYVDSYIHNQLPYLSEWLPGFGFFFDQHRRGFAVTDLVSGDFNNDGNTDLAYLMQGLVIPPAPNPNTTNLVVMEGTGDGRFFVDFQYDRSTDSPLNKPFDVLYTGANGWGEVQLSSSVVQEGHADTSRLVTARVGDNKFFVAAYETDIPPPLVPPLLPGGPLTDLGTTTLGAGNYRVSWPDPDPTKPPPTFQNADVLGFTILDLNAGGKDGFWDMAAINQNNALTLFSHDPAADALLSRPPLSGVALTGERTLFGPDNVPEFFAITTGDFDGDPTTSEVAVLGDDPAPAGWSFRIIGITGLAIGERPPQLLNSLGSSPAIAPEQSEYAPFDITTGVGGATGFVVTGRPSDVREPYVLTPAFLFLLNDNTLNLKTGNGGASRLGNGGVGGGLGQGSLFSVTDPETGQESQSGAFNFVQPPSRFAQVTALFNGGSGGDGFINGGRGGAISGFRSSFAPGTTLLAATVSLTGGNGGSALEGAGGAGGALANFYTEYGSTFLGGSGGSGSIGGNGGSVRANTADLQSTGVATVLTVQAGAGGDGMSKGGVGGGAERLSFEWRKPTAGEGGALYIETGRGGDAIAGAAGAGGSTNLVSPFAVGNYLVGPISLIAGGGGNGLVGGAGGQHGAFTNSSTAFSTPTLINVLAGNGGTGVVGDGGRGGSVSDFFASGTGIEGILYQFNRIIAGDGGDSYGARGGVGGVLASISTAANSSAMAVAAGAGGDGLTRGGNGGSVTKTTADSSAADDAAKVVVFAGQGGSAYAALASSSNVGLAGTSEQVLRLRAFGGVAGVAGNGGSISNFSQPKTLGAAVDLVAGNGGSLMNYGSPGDAKTNVGTGGSIQNVKLVGEAGRVTNDTGIAKDIAIKSYGPDFVQTTLRDAPDTQLTSAVGNVGVIVGEAGRVRADLIAGDGTAKAGSVSAFTARNIMSMVAGSVDRIAQFRVAGAISAVDGIYGAYKDVPNPHPANSPLYLLPDGLTTSATPTVGGKLMDGAIYTLNKPTSLVGARVF